MEGAFIAIFGQNQCYAVAFENKLLCVTVWLPVNNKLEGVMGMLVIDLITLCNIA